MRFSFLATVVTLTAAMSVSACSGLGEACKNQDDCCPDYGFGDLECYSGECITL
ncbi:hypothetical protein K503DRAFT_777990 [Rhizopogon vinicolor AM-OR11-026]|uniref:Uncharacterized protein n=1 Tax=Rhizopogon vinicolor AM-OR11-026 TaxID=1314800 RepID=A0A1B7ME72_9AGAM|nr:hypothetical protein K503DRAFT_777990 [Rhizopogon vinicolor AM-OR11-026]